MPGKSGQVFVATLADVALHSASLDHCAHHAQSQMLDTVLDYTARERYW